MLCVVTQLKDLKKQVQSERIRADRLQEKLQQFLAESPHSQQSMYTWQFGIHIITDQNHIVPCDLVLTLVPVTAH